MITSHRIDPVRILESMWRRLAVLTVYSILVVAYGRVADAPAFLPIAIPTILATLLSILLGFETSAAYDRWWEARRTWGAIVNESRTFARQATTLVSPRSPGDEQAVAALRRDLVYRQIAWAHALARSLRGQDPLQGLDAYLFPGEVRELAGSANGPSAILQRQGEQLRAALDAERIDATRFQTIESTVTRLTERMGACEGIKSTVFPAHYRDLVSRVVWILALVLPWSLVLSLGWGAVPITLVVVSAFWMIESIGEALANPFENRATDTPMTALAQTIEIDLRQQLGESDVPQKLPPVDGILM